MRKRTQKMMQVTPMWIPMMIPVADVLLADSSFIQLQGGLRSKVGEKEEGEILYTSGNL